MVTKNKEYILEIIANGRASIAGNKILTLLYSALNSAENKNHAMALTTRGMIENYLQYLLTDIDIEKEDTRLFYEGEDVIVPFSNVLLLRISFKDNELSVSVEQKCGIWSEENALTYYADFFCGVKSPGQAHKGDVLIMAVLQNWVENRGVMKEKISCRDIWEFAAFLDCALFKVITNAELGCPADICMSIIDKHLGNMYDRLDRAYSFDCKSGRYLLEYFSANMNAVRNVILEADEMK